MGSHVMGSGLASPHFIWYDQLMSRPLRIEYNGAVYHITSRGNARQNIFLDDEDKKRFLDTLTAVIERYNWLCHAYCLMNNHYHLTIETLDANLSRGMRQLNGVYTQVFNRKHRLVGHLFQGRYKAILVEKERYLLALCRYIVLNPVRAGLVTTPGDWRWSSYNATLGNASPAFFSADWLLSQFAGSRRAAQKEYKQFVMAGSDEEFPGSDLKGQVILGSADFLSKIRDMYTPQDDLKEIPRIQRYATRPKLEELFGDWEAGGKASRDKVIYKAYVECGYTLSEIAAYLGVHYSTVSRAVSRVEEDKIWHCKT